MQIMEEKMKECKKITCPVNGNVEVIVTRKKKLIVGKKGITFISRGIRCCDAIEMSYKELLGKGEVL